MKNIIVYAMSTILILSAPCYLIAADENTVKKENVKKQDAQKEVMKALYSIGLAMPAFGNDPCQGLEKTMGGMKKSGSASITLGKLPQKPSVNVGKQGQIMEGESDRSEEDQEIINEMDAAMNDFLNNNKESAENHLNNAREINDDRTRRDMEEVKNSENPTKEQLDRLAEDIHTGWAIGRNDDSLDRQAWQEFAKGATRSSDYPEERKEWLKRTIYTPNPENVSCDSYVCKKADELRAKYKELLGESIDKGKKQRISGQEKIGGKSFDKGMQPTETYPGEATKSGYEKEKIAKTKKDETIIPSDSASQGGGKKIDFCGRGIPSPEEASAMGFNPARITDPVEREWTGKIEQQETFRTLTWTKTVRSNTASIKISHSYKDGELAGIKYEFFDKNGNKTGYATYDGKTGSIEAKRLKK